jgi:hypothetical protein
MPADSDVAETEVSLPHTWRPLGVRLAGAIFGGALLTVALVAWFAFDPETRARFTIFQRVTLLALGALAFSVFFALVRSRVVAETDRLVVVNGYRRREYEWAELIAVHLPPGAPWAVLDLADGTSASAMGIQGSDGGRAQRAVRELRALIARSSAA